ncbi:MAG TPA: single-stranded DNA-binding protein [Clostridia bacterium]|nr:single-stranded DNA-binding protein [Clostridia bacterium]
MLNCIVLNGRLVADPELRTTGSDISVTSFTIAVDRDFVRAGEERKTDFIRVVAWRQTAEFVKRFFFKGSLILVQGSLQTDNYVDKDGIKRYTFDVVADKINFCGPKTDAPPVNRVDDAAANAPAPSFATGNAGDFNELPTDEDLPF